jgi:hypothetical protein
MIKGLSPATEQVFVQVSRMNSLSGYTLIGGTALALQLQHRLSEDLDFCKWKSSVNNRITVDWNVIENELQSIGKVKTDLLGDNQCDFFVQGVKLSFYGNNIFYEPENLERTTFLNHIVVADVESIGIMKMEVMSRRRTFRDYYDMYVILESGVSLENIISGAGKYTKHRLSSKSMLSILSNIENFTDDAVFPQLNPSYDADTNVMRASINTKIQEYIKKRKTN